MNRFVMALVLVLACVWVGEGEARREIKTARQKERLAKAERVLIDALALTDKGEVDAQNIRDLVVSRMKQLGYLTVTDRSADYDVIFRVKCEQRKMWEGTGTSGGDADLPDSPSRVWKGPACQLTYLLSGKKLGWHKEVRTEFEDAVTAAAEAKQSDPGAFALEQLQKKLQAYDFPVLVTADWNQVSRLLTLLDEKDTNVSRKVKIISVLGEIFAVDAIPRLSEIAKGQHVMLAEQAVHALGKIGNQGTIPLLTDLLKSEVPAIQAAAAKALGMVGSLNYDFSVVDPLLATLSSEHVGVKTEVAWALGKVPDRKALPPLRELQQELHSGKADKVSPEVKELQKAVFWSLRQISPVDHVGLE